ncbi:DNA excision repair protein (Rad26L), putative [Paecilomyces variotii No. 5]|uniref:DNA excision repair protein (Rad26L), putative n=1 Tax=Byssochlamys spectabilis (strain No. 5 / NBRC 109023) TaxID=1356009 RepID=V5F8Z6_BYSSN|nr:DNA excision repair protein (Rad26L), putative [Paecilomyces variotii No. 5]
MGSERARQDYDTLTASTDDDDLEGSNLSESRNAVSARREIQDIRSEKNDQERRAPARRRIRSPEKPTVTLSDSASDDSDFNEGAAAYEQFKNRKSLKRKRAIAESRKARSAGKNSIVGRRPRNNDAGPSRKRRQLREYNEVSSDDELMEYTLPDYLQKRRAQFDKRLEHLKQSGLKLPPDFDDVAFSDDERLETLKEKPEFKHIRPCGKYKDITLPYSLGLIPAPIAQWLREYQVEGAAFLHELFVYQKGGVLGDDMGLGKTVQVIAFLTAAYGKTGDERDAKRMRKMRRSRVNKWYPRTLIVCPGTLIENWKSEFDRWGWWHVEVFHGDRKEEALQAAKSGRLEILITTYTTYRMNKDSINMVEWDCVVADECHIIKERKSETTNSMNEVNALCRIGLTGTAIQNKYEELWTLLNWTNPGKLGPVTTWKTSISDPLKIGQSHDATLYQLSKARKTAKKLVENLLPAFFLRRMKTLIADQLPKKSDRVVFCPLTDTQADAYENFLSHDIVEYIKTSSETCGCGSGKKAGWCCHTHLPSGEKWQSYVFPAIANLQKLSNHLAILIPQPADPQEKQDKDLEMLQIAVPDQWRELYLSRGSIMNFSNPEFCGKWKVLRKLLKWWHANGDKVLIFSHSVRLLKMLQMLFNHTSYNVSYLDGAMSYEDRAKIVDDFNSDPQQFVFLISTRAGGVGLNITSANKVVVVDPNWNPSHDLQAQDRAYRIGQHRDVEVFRLISAGTIEEIVYARQIYKQQQANIGYNASSERRYFKGVQEKKDQKGEIFGLSNLFEYQNDNIVLREIVNKTNIAESKAGVQVIGIDVDQDSTTNEDLPFSSTNDDDEDGAMSQLAALITGDADKISTPRNNNKSSVTPKKHDPVQAILAGAGVEYTHLNNEVIGSSKIEERLSRRAELAEETLGEEQVFRDSQDDIVVSKDSELVKFRYHPPKDVMKRQFCSMAKRYGFNNATEFALVVEGMTQSQRRACLEKWYKERREILMKERGSNKG